MEETGVKRRYCECTGTAQPQRVIYNDESRIVAAVGGIPDHLRVEGGITLRIPIPNLKNLHEDFTERLRVYFEELKDGLAQATKKTPVVCSICKQEEVGDFVMVQVDITPSLPPATQIDTQSLPSHSNLIDQSMEKDVGYPDWTIEHDNSDGCTYLVRNRADVDFSEYMYYKGVVIDEPGIVAAVGGIPHELKIEDGISFSMPCPVFKLPKPMPEDPTEYQKIMGESYKEAMESDAFIIAFVQAYIKAKHEALGFSSSSICHKEEEAHNVDQQPTTMLEFNIAATPGWYYCLRSVSSDPIPSKLDTERSEATPGWYQCPGSISSDPIPSKLDMERSEVVKAVCICEGQMGNTSLLRKIGDFIEVVPLMAITRLPGLVTAIGGIPNELKIEGALSFWCPSPIAKYPKKQLQDRQVKYGGLNVSAEFISSMAEGFCRPFDNARRGHASSTFQQEPHNIDPLRPMMEVNMLESRPSLFSSFFR